MSSNRKLGIWMDHSGAHLMEFTATPMNETALPAKFSHQGRSFSAGKSESLMHNKEQAQQAEYYKQLGEVIKNYESVVLFGPTNAKAELKNILRADPQFAQIEIDVQQAGKMTENQQHAFVKAHFSKS